MPFSNYHRGKDARASSRPKYNSSDNNKPYSLNSSSPSCSRTKTSSSSSTSTRTPYHPRRRTQTQPQRVIIVGASIHGLILAILLQRLRIDYLILERSCEYGISPNGIVLGSFAVNLLEMLGLVDIVKSRSTEVHRMKIWRENGIIQAETDFSGAADRYSHNGIAIAGRVLQEILRAQVPGDKILNGKEVKGYVQDEVEVRASCQDGDVYWGTMLVGCDGMNSTIRKLLHQEQAARLSAEDRRQDRRMCSVMGVTKVLDEVTYLDPDTMQDIFRMDHINSQVILGQAEPYAVRLVIPPSRNASSCSCQLVLCLLTLFILFNWNDM
jgi:2-polyprenyl-6-methoxyphenol hydroxylase-like FAD-dependent oxidoreductase